MIVLVIDLLPKERSQLEWRQWSLSLTFLGGRCFQIDLLQSQPLHFDWVHRSSNKYNIMPLKLLTPKNHLSFPLILSNLSFSTQSEHFLYLMIQEVILFHLLNTCHPSSSHIINYFEHRKTPVLLSASHSLNCCSKSTSSTNSSTTV